MFCCLMEDCNCETKWSFFHPSHTEFTRMKRKRMFRPVEAAGTPFTLRLTGHRWFWYELKCVMFYDWLKLPISPELMESSDIRAEYRENFTCYVIEQSVFYGVKIRQPFGGKNGSNTGRVNRTNAQLKSSLNIPLPPQAPTHLVSLSLGCFLTAALNK